MKTVVTILQTKRVFLPYVFTRYIAPEMKKRFGDEFVVHIIQHEPLAGKSKRLATSQLADDKLGLVKKWTDIGKYEGAQVLRHQEWLPEYPSIPSMRIAAEIALKEQADFHLWLEDDALVYDTDCNKWSKTLEENWVGVYRNPGIINTAYFLSRPQFDAHILPFLKDTKIWTHPRSRAGLKIKTRWLKFYHRPNPSRLESRFAIEAKGRITVMNHEFAARVHVGKEMGPLHKLLKSFVPENELQDFKIDFPEELQNSRTTPDGHEDTR